MSLSNVSVNFDVSQMIQRTCKHLGFCQTRSPRCADCPSKPESGHVYFAPGVIERLPLSRKARIKQVLMDAATIFVAAAAAGVSWGYVAAMAWKAGWL